jgi:hypothetical protein
VRAATYDPAIGLQDFQIRQLALNRACLPPRVKGVGPFLKALYKV